MPFGASRAAATEAIVTEGIVDAPVAAVWNAWTTQDGLETWLAPSVDIDLRIFTQGNAATLVLLQKRFPAR